MKNVKRIAADLHETLKDPGFESFIVDQILTSKSSKEDDPIVSMAYQDTTIDIWKKGTIYTIVKSILPGSRKAGKGFTKQLKRNEVIEEIQKNINQILD